MKNIKIFLWAFLLGSSALWFLADSLLPQPFTYFSFRHVFNQYSGILTIGAMSLCMILSVRPVWLENLLGGLDKGYRLHKWLGITALVTALAHFWFTKGTKWMVGWGWLAHPERRGRPGGPGDSGIEQWMGSMRGIAEDIGEWAFYIALALMVVALVKRIPYHWFAKLHTWLAAAYLALVFHAVVLIKFAYWKQPVGWLAAVLLAGGTVSALMVLFNRHGATRRSLGTVAAVEAYPPMNASAVDITAPQWHGHHPGQFAFVRHTGGTEGAHPFTVASAWNAQTGTLRFIIKNLGDYTARTADIFQAGDTVALEGPYGRFTFDDEAATQIWIAGGIGITPFLARLDELPHSGGGKNVHLFYSYRENDPAFLEQLRQAAQAAGVNLHLWPSAQKGRLNAETLHSAVTENLPQCSVWFCGGTDFGLSLKRDLVKLGLPEKQFHQELFEMR